jgi:transposase-like protein
LNLIARSSELTWNSAFRVATETLCQELIDAQAAVFIGAAPFERTRERQRNAPAAGTAR